MTASTDSITTWTRLEPRCRTESTEESLEARILDPLWMLARQWQLGEFLGEDAGSPVAARVRGKTYRLTQFSPGVPEAPAPVLDYDSREAPLEVMVEREDLQVFPAGEGHDPTTQAQVVVEAGQHLARLLKEQGLLEVATALAESSQFRITLPTAEELAALDSRTARMMRFAAGRIPDGLLLYSAVSEALTGGTGAIMSLLDSLGLETPSSQLARDFESVARTWRTWYLENYSEPAEEVEQPPAWRASRQEYRFSVAAAASNDPVEELTLVARGHLGGRLDWHAFDASATPLGGTGRAPEAFVTTVIPGAVRYAGMPASRWWGLEDADVSFGTTESSPEDVTGMLLTEFALTYGNDWSLVPLRLPVGSLSRIDSLVVTDSFGVRMWIRSAEESAGDTFPWRMFEPAWEERDLPRAGLKYLFLAPALPRVPDAAPIESVLFLRDEGANMAWALEELVPGPGGGALNRAEAWMKRHQLAESSSSVAGAELRYSLSTTVPDYWLPLLPRKALFGSSIRLILGQMPAVSTAAGASSVEPMGRILQELNGSLKYLEEEEVPREGAKVVRMFKQAHWTNGAFFRWVGRRKTTGRGAGSSGLRFDVLESSGR